MTFEDKGTRIWHDLDSTINSHAFVKVLVTYSIGKYLHQVLLDKFQLLKLKDANTIFG